MFQPAVGRWLSPDPAGFVDGPNVYLYAGNSSISQFDPSGEILVTQINSREPKCPSRAGRVTWQFKLFDKAACNGFIIQNVRVSCNVSKCDEEGQDLQHEYWEAWRVKKGQIRSSQFGGNDQATFPLKSCQIGRYEQTAEIRFYCNDAIGLPEKNQGNSIPGWDPAGKGIVFYPNPNHVCKTTAGGLTSTGARPAFWSSLTGAVSYSYRWFLQTWRCCPKRKPCCSDGAKDAKLVHSP